MKELKLLKQKSFERIEIIKTEKSLTDADQNRKKNVINNLRSMMIAEKLSDDVIIIIDY